MIFINYKRESSYLIDFIYDTNEHYWITWSDLGCFKNITNAVNAIVEKGYTLIYEDKLTYKAMGRFDHFYDTDTKEFLSIESPWKVGLNDNSLL